jgi:hypothetical protein
MVHELLVNAVLIVAVLFALDRYEAQWAPRVARRVRPHLRALPRSAPRAPVSEHRKAS